MTGPGLPGAVAVRDVTLRDGLQDEPPVPIATKLALFEALVAAGVTQLELTSFVRPDRVPALADAEALAAATDGAESRGVVRWGLVLNAAGAQRALAAGLTHLQYVLSVSEEHNRRNANRTPAQSLAELEKVAGLAHGQAEVEVTLATAFGCPYSGRVPAGAVTDAARTALEAGADALSLADTIGTGVPTEVAERVTAVRGLADGLAVGVHLHDTRGLGVANALAALAAGADRVDGTVGGLGGCPFAPGATGNLALEDLVHALDGMGVATGVVLSGLLEAATLACSAVGKPVASHVGVAGPRFAGPAPR